MLKDLLQELDALWERIGYVPTLAPGLPVDEIVMQLEDAGLPVRSELVDWFSWHNGLSGTERYFIPPTTLRPCALADAIETSARMTRTWEFGPEGWHSAWLFFDCDDHAVFDLSSMDDRVALREWDIVDHEFQEVVASPSLTQTVSLWVECLRNAPIDGYEQYGLSLPQELQRVGLVSFWGWSPE